MRPKLGVLPGTKTPVVKISGWPNHILALVQCPLDIATLDKAAALAIATATCVTDLRQYIDSNLGYSDLKFSALYTN